MRDNQRPRSAPQEGHVVGKGEAARVHGANITKDYSQGAGLPINATRRTGWSCTQGQRKQRARWPLKCAQIGYPSRLG